MIKKNSMKFSEHEYNSGTFEGTQKKIQHHLKVIFNLLWSEFAETNERRFDLLLQILITHWLFVIKICRSRSKRRSFVSAHLLPSKFKATSWSTILYAHISATTQQIITKFSAVATYVKWRQSWKFQFICIWVTMFSKYIIPPIRGKVAK